jgi:uncharacterized repeat protein (TIGR01451 family)
VDPTVGPATFTETVTGINGNGAYPTTMGFAANISGVWHWVAMYGGDANNNSAPTGPLDEPVTVEPAADLAITKTVDNAAPPLGTLINYTVTVRNNGPDTATNVIMADPLPPGLTLVAASPSQGSYNGTTGVWTVGTLVNGASAVLGITAQTVAAGPIVNNAVTGGDQFDPDLSNNQATVEVMVQPEISKRFLLASDPPGSVDPSSFPQNAKFVAQVYRDLLHRESDPLGQASWSDFLDNGGSRSQLVMGFENSPEYLGNEVDGVYNLLLLRSADAAGRNAFINFLESGGTLTQMESAIAGSAEYFRVRGGGTNDGFLAALYQDGLNRAVDASGQATWLPALAKGLSRTQLAASIFNSTEYDTDLVSNYYSTYLRRPADTPGLSNWVALLQAGVRDEEVLANILASDEYFSQVA